MLVVILQTLPLLAGPRRGARCLAGWCAWIWVALFRMLFIVAAILACFISLDINAIEQNGEYYGLLIFSRWA